MIIGHSLKYERLYFREYGRPWHTCTITDIINAFIKLGSPSFVMNSSTCTYVLFNFYIQLFRSIDFAKPFLAALKLVSNSEYHCMVEPAPVVWASKSISNLTTAFDYI